MAAIWIALVMASAQAGPPAQAEQTIVVTGTRLSESERRLRDCLARNCPPNEDIDATLAHVENLFVSGNYEEARRTAKASISRNDKHAAAFPVPVSELYRSNARLSAHLGERRDYVSSTYSIRRALKAGLSDKDPQVVGSGFEVAAMKAQLGDVEGARHAYADVEADARRIGRRDLAAHAAIRRAWLSHLAGNTHVARPQLERIAAETDPQLRVPRLAALILLSRIDRQAGRTARADQLIAEVQKIPSTKPVLLYAPPIDTGTREPAEGETGSVTRLMATDTFEDKWIDVGFWIEPNGRVSDLEILRESGSGDWAKPVLKSIAGRIYSATPGEAAAPGAYRVERYTYTAHWTDVSGTRLRQRSPKRRIEFLDLTATQPSGT